jgi:hypothetical protein
MRLTVSTGQPEAVQAWRSPPEGFPTDPAWIGNQAGVCGAVAIIGQ